MGQSGGGYAVVGLMALYDGNNDGLFVRAIPRSIQRSGSFPISELQVGVRQIPDMRKD